MAGCTNSAQANKNCLKKGAKTSKRALGLLVLVAIVFSYEAIFPLVYATVGSTSGNEILIVDAASKEGIAKFLNLGERISGKITVSGGDNYISFKLFDPSGNLCIWINVLQLADFSWGPVEESGEYKLEFDNWFDSSNGNTVNLEFQIMSPLDNSFPTTLVIIIVLVLAIIIIPAAFLLYRHRESKKSNSVAIFCLHTIFLNLQFLLFFKLEENSDWLISKY